MGKEIKGKVFGVERDELEGSEQRTEELDIVASVKYTAAQREMKLRSSKPKTYNMNVVRNYEIRLLVKGNFK